MHPFEILQGYRLGGHRATVELQKAGAPGIHIDFRVLDLVEDIRAGQIMSVILTGTAGDGKTYLAYRVIEALKLDLAQIRVAQRDLGYDQDGVYIDLDLSAGPLTEERVRRLHQVLGAPDRLTLICANEGKLSELEERFRSIGLEILQTPLRINLSRRALVSAEAWERIWRGVLDAPFWDEVDSTEAHPLTRNRIWLQNSVVAENVRHYLMLPYLLGEPITIREVLSFLACILTGDLSQEETVQVTDAPNRLLAHFLFNTLFSEPAGYVHGGRATPGEKLLLWMFRFDPGAMANPETDLELLTQLDQLDPKPPNELLDYWRTELITRPDERSDVGYRQRMSVFMRYARRWYAIFSREGHKAYFPFRYFDTYVKSLSMPPDDLEDEVPTLIKGLNLLLSGGRIDDEFNLYLYHTSDLAIANQAVIYSNTQVPYNKFGLMSDLVQDECVETYLEQHPRRLYLTYPAGGDPDKQIRLPVSLLLYEVLMGAASPSRGFPATLWTKERYAVSRFMGALNRLVEKPPVAQFVISIADGNELKLAHNVKRQLIQIT